MKASLLKKLFFFTVLFIFCIGFASVRSFPDSDLWARLIAGAHIVEIGSIIKNDFLSYTPTHLWYDHEWGSSVVFYSVLKYFGEAGLVLLRGILLFLTVLFCFLTVRERKSEQTNPYNILYYVFMFFAAVSSTGPVVRCLLFTALFFAVSIYILERARNGKNKTLFILPPLMLVWCNMHGGCLSLAGILAVYAFGEFLNGKDFKKYIYTLIGCFAVLFINPYGTEYVRFLFEAGTMNREYITEWLSPYIKNYALSFMTYKIYSVFVITSVLFVFFKNKPEYNKIDKTKYIVVLLMLFLSVMRVRFISFFVFTAGTLLYDDVYLFLNSLFSKIQNNKKLVTLKEFVVYSVLLILSLPLFVSDKTIRITETKFPRFAVEFIKINDLKGKLFVNFESGSYCAYKLFPHNLIVMDGRYEEVYNPDLLLELKNFHLVKNDWNKIIREYPPDVMIIEKNYPVYKKLVDEGQYSVVFENNVSAVFVPSDKVKTEYIYPEPSDEYYNNRLFDTDIDFIKIKNKNKIN